MYVEYEVDLDVRYVVATVSFCLIGPFYFSQLARVLHINVRGGVCG